MKLKLTFCNVLFSTLLILIPYSVNAQDTRTIPMQTFDQNLHDQLPEQIKQSKQIIAVNDGNLPPYVIVDEKENMSGLSVDLNNAISQILGVTIVHKKAATIPAIITGIKAGRYDMTLSPMADIPSRQDNSDFVDYALSYSVFAVKKGNPSAIESINDLCGKTIAFIAGGSGEERLGAYSENCVKENKQPINKLAFKDLAGGILAVSSDRADACFNSLALLSYYVANSNGELELTGTQFKDLVPQRYHATLFPKDSPLAKVYLAALEQLFSNGTYQAIMLKWNMEAAILPATGINLAQ